MDLYWWPSIGEFKDRQAELARLEAWWESPERQPIALIGRRRVGKSWLFRRFAHGKPAVVLVADQLPQGAQLRRFAHALEPTLGVLPELADLRALFRVAYRAGERDKILFIIDEFPWLLGPSGPEARRALSTIHSVMEEERDRSQIKLVVCGSQLGQMNALFDEANPMHGRLVRLEVRPLRFEGAAELLVPGDPIASFERYAIAGGMPIHLDRLAAGSVRESVCGQLLDPRGPLWNEGRSILEQELREPRVYFGILEQLAWGGKELDEIAQPLRLDAAGVSRYLSTLVDLQIVRRRVPIAASIAARSGHWHLEDGFLRSWFRFVFPFQASLEGGLAAADLYDTEVAPALAGHVAPVFEDWCREWLRAHRGTLATTVGAWWGKAANTFRRTGERSSEEIDAVGMAAGRVTLLAECKWTSRPLGARVVTDLDQFKVPALRDAGMSVVHPPRIVLFCKGGYSAELRRLAEREPRVELVDVAEALTVATHTVANHTVATHTVATHTVATHPAAERSARGAAGVQPCSSPQPG